MLCTASGNIPAGLMSFPNGNLPQQNLMGLNNPFGANPINGLPQAGGNHMMALAAQQQLFNLGGDGMNGVLPQQNQYSGIGGLGGGMSGFAGMDLTKVNLSDSNNLAVVQQLLNQQSGGGDQYPGALASLGMATQQPQNEGGDGAFTNNLGMASHQPQIEGDAGIAAQSNNVAFQTNNNAGQPPAPAGGEEVGQSAIV